MHHNLSMAAEIWRSFESASRTAAIDTDATWRLRRVHMMRAAGISSSSSTAIDFLCRALDCVRHGSDGRAYSAALDDLLHDDARDTTEQLVASVLPIWRDRAVEVVAIMGPSAPPADWRTPVSPEAALADLHNRVATIAGLPSPIGVDCLAMHPCPSVD